MVFRRYIFPLLTLFFVIGVVFYSIPPAAQAGPRTATRQIAFDRAVQLTKTINIGRWFGRGVPATTDHYLNYISSFEARRIKTWGFTAVRLPIREPFLFVASKNDAGLDVQKLKILDAAVSKLNKANLTVILDFHSKERKRHESDYDYQQRMLRFWELLSQHTSKKYQPSQVILELLNEPRFIHAPADWNRLQKMLFASVRKNAPDFTIIATSTHYSDPQSFSSLAALNDDNIIYTFHTYDPIAFTHQGADFLDPRVRSIRGLPFPPGDKCSEIIDRVKDDSFKLRYVEDYCASGWNADKFRDYLSPALDWAKRKDVPIFVGEFGARAEAMPEADRLRWLFMARSFFEKKGLSWALWSLDDCYGLALKVQGACPAGAGGKIDSEASWRRACRTLGALGLEPKDCSRRRPSQIIDLTGKTSID